MITLFLSIIAGISFGLFIREVLTRPKPPLQYTPDIFDENRTKSIELLHQAVKNANDIISQAEHDALKVVEGSKLQTNQLEQVYQQKINALTSHLEESFKIEVENANKQFAKYLQDLQASGKQTQTLIEETARQQINDLFERFEQNLSTFLTQTQQQSIASIELEIRAARQLIETYKSQQLALVDENIIAILEKTLALVLSKKLDLKDHLELVRQSLEKAKAEKFLV